MGSLSRVVPCGGGRLHDGGERPARRAGRKCGGKRPDDCHDSAESLEEKWKRSRSMSPPCWSGLKGRHHLERRGSLRRLLTTGATSHALQSRPGPLRPWAEKAQRCCCSCLSPSCAPSSGSPQQSRLLSSSETASASAASKALVEVNQAIK